MRYILLLYSDLHGKTTGNGIRTVTNSNIGWGKQKAVDQAASSAGLAIWSVTLKVVPSPSMLWTPIAPPK